MKLKTLSNLLPVGDLVFSKVTSSGGAVLIDEDVQADQKSTLESSQTSFGICFLVPLQKRDSSTVALEGHPMLSNPSA